jgi:SynChlorMet cassette radical SAM/SPASM protein ScmF
VRNEQYHLYHLDDESGFGLIYSETTHDCVILTTLATVLWNAARHCAETAALIQLAGDYFDFPGSADYAVSTLRDLWTKGVLRGAPERPITHTALEKQTLPSYALQQLYIYVTRECNARCYHCYQPVIRPANKRLSVLSSSKPLAAADFLKLVEQAIPLGLQRVKLSGGEPLLYSEIRDLIAGIRQFGIGVSVESNGFYLDERIADVLVEQSVDVSVSLDGGSAAIHDTLRGLPGSFDRVLQALRFLSERGGAPKAIMAVSRRNLHEVESVITAATQAGCRLIKLNPVNTLGLAQGLAKEQVLLTLPELLGLYKRRRQLEQRFGVFVYLEGPPAFSTLFELATGHAGACPFTNLLGVLADGSLSFCGVANSYPELVFARVTDPGFDLAECWNTSAALSEVRRRLLHPAQGVCSQCVLEPLCHGSCRALAYGDFKSFSAPHPWCQTALEAGLFPATYLKGQKGGETHARQ